MSDRSVEQIVRGLGLGAILIITASFGAWGDPPPVPTGVSLRDCYQKARQINESIGISAENVRAVQAQMRSEIGSILPHIDWIKNQFYQQNVNNGATGFGGTALLPTQPLSYFQLQQPIFAGAKDWQVVGILKSQVEQAKLNQRQTDLQLLSDVATAFYTALAFQDQVVTLEEIRKLNQDQVDQLNHWVEIGRSRPSEVLTAQTQLASIDAQLQDAKRSESESRHLLFFLTGVPENVPLMDEGPITAPATVEDALSRAGNRPELLSQAEALHQADLQIRYAKGGHLPTLGLTGRYYTERIGFLSDVRWDATFLLDVPLYEGGSIQAQVRQARSQEIIAQLTLSRLKRDVDRQVRTAFDDVRQSSAELEAYEKAVQLAEKNYEVQKKEYRLGVISNLDLLILLSNMQNVRKDWLVSRSTSRLNDVQLKIAMGEGL